MMLIFIKCYKKHILFFKYFLIKFKKKSKNQTCQHDVTIALFSRIFYKANTRDEFPSAISADIKQDHKKRFYEDFYRVVYQNERFEDWTPTLVILKRLIKEYREYILNYHRAQQRDAGVHVPECYL